MSNTRRAHLTLGLSTLAFTLCFAVWMLNGVLVTWLIDNRVFAWTSGEMGLLIGVPVLTGSVLRLVSGLLTDKFGGRPVFTGLLLLAAVPTYLLSLTSGFYSFLLCSACFGVAGSGFAVGIAFTSVWYPREWQGTVLGIFGAGNAGSAITTLAAPGLLAWLTSDGRNLEGWRTLPRIYAAVLVVMACVFFFGTVNKRPEGVGQRSFRDFLAPLGTLRVWRFGLYYFLVFGGFVALAQWLVPYYLNVYSMSLVGAGMMASIFSFPSGVVRALGGWMSDRLGARRTLGWMFAAIAACTALLFFPKMDIESPGPGVMALRPGLVEEITPTSIRVEGQVHPLRAAPAHKVESEQAKREPLMLWPRIESWQEPAVRVGDRVTRKQLLARGVTHISFQANVWVFTALVFAIGIAMGIGKAAVYRYIYDYFPRDVGVVGGIVGVIGGLGGFVCPIVFGYLLDAIGLWTSTWIFLFAVTVACMVWLAFAVQRTAREDRPAADAEHG